MSPSPQGYRQPWEEPSPEREVFDEMLRRPYEELHAENQRLRALVAAEGRGEILVRFSTQLLAEMEGEWSEPVFLKPERQDDGTYVLTAARFHA
jgi:hypothetical protein